MTTTIKTYPCAICGKRARSEQMLFSRFTRKRYCADLEADLEACRKRSRRKR